MKGDPATADLPGLSLSTDLKAELDGEVGLGFALAVVHGSPRAGNRAGGACAWRRAKRRVGSTVHVCRFSVAYWLRLDLFDRRQQHSERPPSHLLPIRKTPVRSRRSSVLAPPGGVGGSLGPRFGASGLEWQLLEGASQGPCLAPTLGGSVHSATSFRGP